MVRTRRSRPPERVRVATLDVQHGYRRSAVVVGPVDVPSLDVLAARFAAMAAIGPESRVGLQPSTAATRWRYTPAVSGDVLGTTTRDPGDEPLALLATLRQSPGHGIRILAGGDYLAIDFSHGLGEVPLLDLLIGVLLGAVDPADGGVWRPYRHRASPLLIAALRAIALGPQRLIPLWRQHRRNVGMAESVTRATKVDVTPSPATRATQIPAEVVTDLRRRRDSALPGVSMFALYTCALHRAFAAAGFDVDPTVTLPFDVRRYLPGGRSTLASFSAGLDFRLDGGGGPRRLHREMADAGRMARPVANLMAGTAKTRIALRSGRHPQWQLPAEPRLRLLHSSVGTVPHGPWEFSDPGQARILVASDPVSPCGVTVTTASVLGSLWLTAEFHDTLFDAETLSRALDSVPEQVRALTA
ncbi:hypothetical protein FHR72_001933 [Mycolicibacterium iranicum]|uniref:Diacylglycerol O-acyltransferase n=1 Tax=Mycolicibacterium iranicum TaxID=912594 RepID=A0A839Q7S9_MYCIR|nr:hypothetical protein [Mycolicibacterium iranicum]MBB2990465.1 hypothetical protein [Mycolicibacterium iranicum]